MSQARNELARQKAGALSKIVRMFMLTEFSEADLHIINTSSDRELTESIERLSVRTFSVPILMRFLNSFNSAEERLFKEMSLPLSKLEIPTKFNEGLLKSIPIESDISDEQIMLKYETKPMSLKLFWQVAHLLLVNPTLGKYVLSVALAIGTRYIVHVDTGEIKFSVCIQGGGGVSTVLVYPFLTDKDEITSAPSGSQILSF